MCENVPWTCNYVSFISCLFPEHNFWVTGVWHRNSLNDWYRHLNNKRNWIITWFNLQTKSNNHFQIPFTGEVASREQAERVRIPACNQQWVETLQIEFPFSLPQVVAFETRGLLKADRIACIGISLPTPMQTGGCVYLTLRIPGKLSLR